MQVERRTGKVRRPKTDILPLCHASNLGELLQWMYDDNSTVDIVLTLLHNPNPVSRR